MGFNKEDSRMGNLILTHTPKWIFGGLIILTIYLGSCTNCEKLSLTQNEKDWVNHFHKGQRTYFKNIEGQIDTVEVAETRDFYTPCNKFELSKYQYEVYDVSFVMKSASEYNNCEVLVSYETSDYKPRIPNIFLGNIGPYKNDLENKMPSAIDTVLGGKKLTSVYYYANGHNAENYEKKKKYFENFFWEKYSGLIAYTTINGEIFIRINQN